MAHISKGRVPVLQSSHSDSKNIPSHPSTLPHNGFSARAATTHRGVVSCSGPNSSTLMLFPGVYLLGKYFQFDGQQTPFFHRVHNDLKYFFLKGTHTANPKTPKCFPCWWLLHTSLVGFDLCWRGSHFTMIPWTPRWRVFGLRIGPPPNRLCGRTTPILFLPHQTGVPLPLYLLTMYPLFLPNVWTALHNCPHICSTCVRIVLKKFHLSALSVCASRVFGFPLLPMTPSCCTPLGLCCFFYGVTPTQNVPYSPPFHGNHDSLETYQSLLL